MSKELTVIGSLPGTPQIILGLRRRRRELNLTRVELAEKMGTTDGVIYRWEMRRASPSIDNFIAWANALGCDVATPLRGGGNE